jgi:hypothetical protein
MASTRISREHTSTVHEGGWFSIADEPAQRFQAILRSTEIGLAQTLQDDYIVATK